MPQFDNVLHEDKRKLINAYLHLPGWEWGWKSRPNVDAFAFWHKHFAGALKPDHPGHEREEPYDCAAELKAKVPLLYGMWEYLAGTILKGHRIVRCYANAYPYGTDGTLHTDSAAANSYTSVYYPHERWSPNWGGETVFFNKEETEIIGACYPTPNRLLVFPGTVPHVARGVSRMCPELRITLMFKSELIEATADQGCSTK